MEEKQEDESQLIEDNLSTCVNFCEDNKEQKSSTCTSKKRKHQSIPIAKKAVILQQIIDKQITINQASKIHSIPHNTISTWLKSKGKILGISKEAALSSERKRQRVSEYEDVQKALIMWFKEMRHSSPEIGIDGPVLKMKAEEFANGLGLQEFVCSNGFLERFKSKYGISFKVLCGESAAISPEMTKDWYQTTLPELVANFPSQNIFNCDEFGLFYKATPAKTYALKKEKCHGGKHAKDRITIIAGANMAGTEKLPLLVIGKSKKPRCFKGIN